MYTRVRACAIGTAQHTVRRRYKRREKKYKQLLSDQDPVSELIALLSELVAATFLATDWTGPGMQHAASEEKK